MSAPVATAAAVVEIDPRWLSNDELAALSSVLADAACRLEDGDRARGLRGLGDPLRAARVEAAYLVVVTELDGRPDRRIDADRVGRILMTGGGR